MRGGYLATESSRDTPCQVGSLNNSGITVRNAQDTVGSSHNQQTYHGVVCLKSAVQGCGRRLDQSKFRPMAEVSVPVLVNPAKAKERRPLLAGKHWMAL